MALHELNAAKDELSDIAGALEEIDYTFPTEPADDAPQDDWRNYALAVADLLVEAEKVTDKAARDIRS